MSVQEKNPKTCLANVVSKYFSKRSTDQRQNPTKSTETVEYPDIKY